MKNRKHINKDRPNTSFPKQRVQNADLDKPVLKK